MVQFATKETIDAVRGLLKTYADEQASKRVLKGDLARNVLDHGAVGDGTADDTAALVDAVSKANGGEVYLPAGKRFLVKDAAFTTEHVNIGGPGVIVQPLGFTAIRVERPWGPAIDVNAPSIIQFGATGIQGAQRMSALQLPAGGYSAFTNGDAYHISSNDNYPGNFASGGTEVQQVVMAGFLSLLGVGMDVAAVANGGPVEGLMVKGSQSQATGLVQSSISQGGTDARVVFSSVSGDFAGGETLTVASGGSTAVPVGTVVGTAGAMYLLKQGDVFDDSYATSVKLRKVPRGLLTKIDVTVQGSGDMDSYVAPSQRKDAVSITGAYYIDVTVRVSGAWSRGLFLQSCYRGHYDVTADGLPNHTGTDQGAFGYGVSISGCSEGLQGRVDARNLRHGHTTNINYTALWSASGTQIASSGSPYTVVNRWGTQKNCRVVGGYGQDCTNAVFDTHPGAVDFEFFSCTARTHSGAGRKDSTSKVLFSTRGIGTKYYDCHAYGGGFQDNSNGFDAGRYHKTIYKGCTTRKAPQYGLVQLFTSASDGAGGFWSELIVEDCDFEMDGTLAPYATQRPILLGAGIARVRNTRVSNFNDAPVVINATSAGGVYEFLSFIADYNGPGRKPFQISGNISEFTIDYAVRPPATNDLPALFESVSGFVNIGLLDTKRVGAANLPPVIVPGTGSLVSYRGLQNIRTVSSPGDASSSPTPRVGGSVIRYAVPLTSTRSVTLPLAGITGDGYRIVRTTAATNVSGTRYVNVVANGVTLAALDVGQWVDVRWDGSAWFVEAASPSSSKGDPGANGALADSLLSVGTETLPRQSVTSSVTMTSGLLRLTYFTARRSETVTRVRVCTSTTAAGATPTLVRLGVYAVDPTTGDLTLIASTVNDPTTFAAASTIYSRNLAASADLVAGARYAFGVLVVTTAAAPTVSGNSSTLPGAEVGTAPALVKTLSGQTDLPAACSAASLGDNGSSVYAVVRP